MKANKTTASWFAANFALSLMVDFLANPNACGPNFSWQTIHETIGRLASVQYPLSCSNWDVLSEKTKKRLSRQVELQASETVKRKVMNCQLI